MTLLRHEAMYVRKGAREILQIRRERLEKFAAMPVLKNTVILIVAHPLPKDQDANVEALRRDVYKRQPPIPLIYTGELSKCLAAETPKNTVNRNHEVCAVLLTGELETTGKEFRAFGRSIVSWFADSAVLATIGGHPPCMLSARGLSWLGKMCIRDSGTASFGELGAVLGHSAGYGCATECAGPYCGRTSASRSAATVRKAVTVCAVGMFRPCLLYTSRCV